MGKKAWSRKPLVAAPAVVLALILLAEEAGAYPFDGGIGVGTRHQLATDGVAGEGPIIDERIPPMTDPSSSNAWVSRLARVPTSTEPRTPRCGTRSACRSIRSGLRNAGLGNTSGLHRPWFGRAKPAWPASRPSRGRPHSRLPKM